jgi:putative spermidine/putrescine transport system permease protein
MRLPVAPAAVAVSLIAFPAFIGAGYSVLAAVGVAGPGAAGFDPGPLIRVITAADTWRSTVWTLATAGVATAIAAMLAAMVALGARDSRLMRWLAVVPIAVPHVAAGLAALLMFSQSGFLSRLAFAVGWVSQPSDFPPLVYDRAGFSLVVAFVWKELPYLTLTAIAVVLTRHDDLHETARTLGGTTRQAFIRITWPLVWRGMAPAALAVFAFLLGQYEMPLLLAPSDPLALPLLTFERSVDPNLLRRGEAHVLSLIALAIAASIVMIHVRVRMAAGRAL